MAVAKRYAVRVTYRDGSSAVFGPVPSRDEARRLAERVGGANSLVRIFRWTSTDEGAGGVLSRRPAPVEPAPAPEPEPAVPVLTSAVADDWILQVIGTGLDGVTDLDVTGWTNPVATPFTLDDVTLLTQTPTLIEVDMQSAIDSGPFDDGIIYEVAANAGSEVLALGLNERLSFDGGTTSATIVGSHIRFVVPSWRHFKTTHCRLYFDDDSDSGILTKGSSPFSDWDETYWGVEKAGFVGKTLVSVEVWRTQEADAVGDETTADTYEGVRVLDAPLLIA